MYMNTMRKTLFRLVFFSLTILTTAFCSVLWAQDCVPNDITLNNQVEVDSFQANHGPCDRLQNLHIQGLDITNLGGLSALSSIVGNVLIQNNAMLTNVDGLSALLSVGAKLTISNNAALSNLDGLSALQWVQSLWVFGNSTLANCRGLVRLVDQIDDYDPGPGGNSMPDVDWDADFGQNLPRCNSVTEILVDAMLVEIPNCTPWRIGLGAQADIDNFQFNHGPCDRVGILTISGADIVNLDGLSALTRVGGLDIGYNPLLTVVNGLQALTSVDAWLIIRGNQRLRTLDGLTGITGVGDNIFISDNLYLLNVDGLSGLTSVGGLLLIRFNTILANLDGLSGLTSAGSLEITGNKYLENLNGLSHLTSVGELLWVRANENLTSLGELSALISVGTDVSLEENPQLAFCSGLTNLLNDIDDGTPGPGPGIGGIPDVGGDVLINNNRPECNSVEDILNNLFKDGFE
jgi:hypothetical protein